MKKIIAYGLFLIFICASINVTALNAKLKTEQNSNDTNYYAVVIGVEEFIGVETPDQEYIDETATRFYHKLLDSENWEEENIKFLLNENATKDKIHDAIVNWLDEKENANDIVVIYYMDHGWKTNLSDRKYGNAYVFTYNATSRYFDEDKISDKEFDSWADVLDSKHIAVILDHCYSGRMLALRQFGRTVVAAGGKYIFCPCNWSSHLESSIFSYYFMEGLNGVADVNNDGWVTAREAFHYARWPTAWHSTWHHFPFVYKRANGKLGFIGPQIPYLYDRHMGDIPLIKYCGSGS